MFTCLMDYRQDYRGDINWSEYRVKWMNQNSTLRLSLISDKNEGSFSASQPGVHIQQNMVVSEGESLVFQQIHHCKPILGNYNME